MDLVLFVGSSGPLMQATFALLKIAADVLHEKVAVDRSGTRV